MEHAGLTSQLDGWLSRATRGAHGKGSLYNSQPMSVLFFTSTTMVLGDGRSEKFWEDRWINGRSISEIVPQLHACIPKRQRKTRTVVDTLQSHAWARDIHGMIRNQEIGQYKLLWRVLEHINLADQADTVIPWSGSGAPTAPTL
jgi:hypothetical protein